MSKKRLLRLVFYCCNFEHFNTTFIGKPCNSGCSCLYDQINSFTELIAVIYTSVRSSVACFGKKVSSKTSTVKRVTARVSRFLCILYSSTLFSIHARGETEELKYY